MQSVIQAAADRIAARHRVAIVQVRRFGGMPEEVRMEYMRHEMAHHIHAAKILAAGVKGAGDNAHGRVWRNIAVAVGCQPKDDNCPMKRVARNMPRRVLAQAIMARNAHVAVAAPIQVEREVCVENPSTRAEWMQYAKVKGLRQLGQGASRTAYALDANWVIKVQTHNVDGINGGQCAAEAKAWLSASAERKQYLATIREYGQGWCIMERAKMTLEAFGGMTRTVSDDLRETTGIADLHSRNIGYFGGGKFKIIDYGC